VAGVVKARRLPGRGLRSRGLAGGLRSGGPARMRGPRGDPVLIAALRRCHRLRGTTGGPRRGGRRAALSPRPRPRTPPSPRRARAQPAQPALLPRPARADRRLARDLVHSPRGSWPLARTLVRRCGVSRAPTSSRMCESSSNPARTSSNPARTSSNPARTSSNQAGARPDAPRPTAPVTVEVSISQKSDEGIVIDFAVPHGVDTAQWP
jgi:hypothetical protein